jgi:hypothetical protein
MKAFLLKYKWKIVFLILFSIIVFYLAPSQHDYYLDSDIDSFKQTHMTPFLLWTGIVTSILVVILVLAKTKSLKRAGVSFLYVGVALAFYLFIFQDLFLGGALFINRQFKTDTLNKSYTISYMTGIDKTKDNLVPYDLSTKRPLIDNKLINKIYNSELRQNDTVSIKFDKGLFGIPFQLKPLDDK